MALRFGDDMIIVDAGMGFPEACTALMCAFPISIFSKNIGTIFSPSCSRTGMRIISAGCRIC
jgi:hypothetical protein